MELVGFHHHTGYGGRNWWPASCGACPVWNAQHTPEPLGCGAESVKTGPHTHSQTAPTPLRDEMDTRIHSSETIAVVYLTCFWPCPHCQSEQEWAEGLCPVACAAALSLLPLPYNCMYTGLPHLLSNGPTWDMNLILHNIVFISSTSHNLRVGEEGINGPCF